MHHGDSDLFCIYLHETVCKKKSTHLGDKFLGVVHQNLQIFELLDRSVSVRTVLLNYKLLESIEKKREKEVVAVQKIE